MTARRAPEGDGAARLVSACFFLSAIAGISLAVVYWRGGQTQAEGALWAVALGLLGAGFVLWAHHLMPTDPYAEDREPLETTPEEQHEFADDFERGGVLERRRLILAALTSAVGALAVALAFPIRSLGPRPGHALDHTPWRPGLRVVTSDGQPVRAAQVPNDGLVTVFPEGHTDSADGPAVLMRVDPQLLSGARGDAQWAPEGLIAFSKVCTHAGCPVGLYEATSHELLCPCHQSAFAVLQGARPISGPADRALPQLPLMIDADGVLRARGDFSSPIGPRTWNMR
ncbi:MAG: Rieske (2Fe-2S) domain protein [Actinomycetia bacterium]|nr:Rieske (2Fe-2S) domain protein [Actinomycetes bacterium]